MVELECATVSVTTEESVTECVAPSVLLLFLRPAALSVGRQAETFELEIAEICRGCEVSELEVLLGRTSEVSEESFSDIISAVSE